MASEAFEFSDEMKEELSERSAEFCFKRDEFRDYVEASAKVSHGLVFMRARVCFIPAEVRISCVACATAHATRPNTCLRAVLSLRVRGD